MKLRSLFLASLAAIAFVSCSNEEDATINGGETGAKDAIVQFGISFSNTVTRGATAGESEAGTAEEQAFNDATIVIEQGGKQSVFTFPFDQFSKVTDGATHQPATLWLKEKIAVNEGAANVYVFLNASSSLKASLESPINNYPTLTESVDFSNGIKALEATGKIAEPNKFLMCNADGTAEEAQFDKNEINTLKVCVGRVTAKLEEMTPAENSYDITDKTINFGNKKITVSLSDFAYTGLQQDTYVLKNAAPITANLYKPYDGTTEFEYQNVKGGVTNYCMENLGGTSLQTTTNIIYKANITVDGTTEGTTIYVTPDNYAFTSIEAMAEAGYKFEGLNENTSIEDCWNTYALKKYENGVCYYTGQIETANAGAKIIRNNIYRLSVNSIKGLGTVLPKTFDDFTLLDLTVEIDPWTVNLNSFDF